MIIDILHIVDICNQYAHFCFIGTVYVHTRWNKKKEDDFCWRSI